MAVERDAWSRSAQYSLKEGFANLDRLASQILAIKLQRATVTETQT
jgi:hypothetical protein